jgi:hypothetical protein|tara:strand:+ start:67 stop:255 length:189 start_codon:yes stop_codon:yes gene_type:complete
MISKHLAFVEETYRQHLWFTVKVSVQLLVLSIILLTHGILPWFFTGRTSDGIKYIGEKLKQR